MRDAFDKILMKEFIFFVLPKIRGLQCSQASKSKGNGLRKRLEHWITDTTQKYVFKFSYLKVLWSTYKKTLITHFQVIIEWKVRRAKAKSKIEKRLSKDSKAIHFFNSVSLLIITVTHILSLSVNLSYRCDDAILIFCIPPPAYLNLGSTRCSMKLYVRPTKTRASVFVCHFTGKAAYWRQ